MSKRLLSAVLAGACALSCMTFAVFAVDDDDNGTEATVANQDNTELEKAGSKSYSITAGTHIPIINVTFPANFNAILNPYGIEVTIDDAGKTSTAGVTSPIYAVTNNTTEVAITVTAKASARGSAGITVLEEDPGTALEEEADEKKVYATVIASTQTPTSVELEAEKTVVFKNASNTPNPEPEALMVLGKATKAEDSDEVTPTNGYIQFGGKISRKAAWTTTDKVTLNLVLGFEIIPNGVDENP